MAELKRYSGKSLEEAMEKVNVALGPGAEIIEAKRVRRGGVLGAMKRDVVEVTARPRPAFAPAADRDQVQRSSAQRSPAQRSSARPARRPASFTDQLDSMLDEIDLREDRQLLQRPAPAQAVARSNSRRFTDDDLAPLDDAPQARQAQRPAPRQEAPARPRQPARPPATRPAPGRPAAARPAGTRSAAATATAPARRSSARNPARPYAPARTAADAAEDAAALAPASPPARATSSDMAPVRSNASASQEIDLRERRFGPEWSEDALRELGVPEVVIDLVPTSVLRSDLEWTVALEAAIRASLPAPTMPVAMCGYGAHSAVKILESMLGGCAMGEMRLKDRAVMATPFELALAVRQCLSQ